MTPELAISALRALGDPERAAKDAAYHKTEREVLGVRVPQITECVAEWRQDLSLEDRVALARALWDADVHETRIAAAKLVTQARLADDSSVWAAITDWMPEVDGWAIADHLADAGGRRLVAHPERLDELQGWTRSRHLWTKRAALIFTLPWAKMANPKPEDLAARERILDWAAAYLSDKEWFIQKAVAWWLRDLSKHDPDTARAFLREHEKRMKPFALKEAQSYLPQ